MSLSSGHPWVAPALLASLAILGACGEGMSGDPPPTWKVALTVDTASAAATVDAHFLSIAVDTAQVVGGLFWDPRGSGSMAGNVKVPPYDFSRARLRKLASALAPFTLRIGGTAADETFYDLSDSPRAKAPAHYKYVLTRKQWDGVGDFAAALGLRLMFTLNAGPGPRDSAGKWTAEQARTLLAYTRKRGYPVDVWELGNEVNGYLLFYKMTSFDGATYGQDLKTAQGLLAVEAPGARLAGPSCAYWPGVGDFHGFYKSFMPVGGKELGLVTWHYYPQQSIRCPVKSRPASAETMLDPGNLDELHKWADEVEGLASKHAPGVDIWLGETGNAQCGGEPGVSDAFAGCFWWLDQLGALARRGHKRVIRQNLSGSNYGLIDEVTLAPKPDYWVSLLWRKLMGQKVLAATVPAGHRLVRVYAHCAGAKMGKAGAVTAALINLDAKRTVRMELPGLTGPSRRYLLSADSLSSGAIKLNGATLKAAADGTAPQLVSAEGDGPYMDLPPRTLGFLLLPEAGAAACK